LLAARRGVVTLLCCCGLVLASSSSLNTLEKLAQRRARIGLKDRWQPARTAGTDTLFRIELQQCRTATRRVDTRDNHAAVR